MVIKKLPNYFCRDLNYSRTSRYEHLSITSLRSRRFRLVSETEERTGFSVLVAPFFARSLTLVPCSLLLNRTETLATQATLLRTCRIFNVPRKFSHIFFKKTSMIRVRTLSNTDNGH